MCSFFLAIIATYAAMRATPTGTVAMIICSLEIIAYYATFWAIYAGD